MLPPPHQFRRAFLVEILPTRVQVQREVGVAHKMAVGHRETHRWQRKVGHRQYTGDRCADGGRMCASVLGAYHTSKDMGVDV